MGSQALPRGLGRRRRARKSARVEDGGKGEGGTTGAPAALENRINNAASEQDPSMARPRASPPHPDHDRWID